MSFEVFYNFFYNIANGNVKNIAGVVERCRSLHAQKRTILFFFKISII